MLFVTPQYMYTLYNWLQIMDPFSAVFIENIHHTLTFLDTRRDILSVATSVSTQWHTQCSDDKLWRLLFKRDWGATEKIIPLYPVFRVEQNIKLLGHASTFYQAYVIVPRIDRGASIILFFLNSEKFITKNQ